MYFPIPQKKLFRDLLSLEPLAEPPETPTIPPPPAVTENDLARIQSFEAQYESLQKELAALVNQGMLATSRAIPMNDIVFFAI